jgi:hypothetical protein
LIRDEYEARGVAVDCQLEVLRNSARPGSSADSDTIIVEPEKPQNDGMYQGMAEAEEENRVNSE